MKSSQIENNVKWMMLGMVCISYLVNSLLIVMLRGFDNFSKLFNNFDFIPLFQLGLIVCLVSVYGYITVKNKILRQILTVAYMLPLTGMSFFSLFVLYTLQEHLDSAAGLWAMILMMIVFLIASFDVAAKASLNVIRKNSTSR